MSIETRKLHLFEEILSIDNEAILAKLESVLEDERLDPKIQKIMEVRALRAEEDIRAGRLYSIEEAESKLNHRLGL